MKKIILAALITMASLKSEAQITSGLVAKYTFNSGNANDETGTNNGSVNGATLAYDRFGNPDKAYSFNGSSSYISLGNSNTLKPSTGTISVWVSMNDISASGTGYAYNPIILAKNDVSGNSYIEGYGLYVSTNTKKALAITTQSQTSNEKYIYSAGAFTMQVWYHLVMAYNNDSLWFYKDGVLESKIAKGFTSTFSSTEPVMLGWSNNSQNNRYFNGRIDDLTIYNRVLTSAEVTSLYTTEPPYSCDLSINAVALNASSGNDGTAKVTVQGGMAPYKYSVNGGTYTQINSGWVCGEALEHLTLTLSTPDTTKKFTAVNFASYGSPIGGCNTTYKYAGCNAATSMKVCRDSILNKSTATVYASNSIFGDPCYFTGKKIAVLASYSEEQVINSLAAGSYTITVRDSLGCEANYSITVNAITGNISNSVSTKNIKIYPTIITSQLTTDGLESDEATVKITTIDGKVILEKHITRNETLDVSGLLKGMYFVEVTETTGYITLSKVIKY